MKWLTGFSASVCQSDDHAVLLEGFELSTEILRFAPILKWPRHDAEERTLPLHIDRPNDQLLLTEKFRKLALKFLPPNACPLFGPKGCEVYGK